MIVKVVKIRVGKEIVAEMFTNLIVSTAFFANTDNHGNILNSNVLIQLNDGDSESNDGSVQRWTEEDLSLLCSAVEAIGENEWHLISNEWFNGRFDEDELKRIWESNQVGRAVHNTVFEENRDHQLTNSTRNMSCRRRKEEDMELRKLFAANARDEVDMELLYRAYIVGYERLDKVLRMNAPRRGVNLKISFSSIVAEMRNIASGSVSACKLSISKLIKKLPSSALDLPPPAMDKMISPLRYSYDNFSKPRFLRLNSTAFPIHDILMKAVVYSEEPNKSMESVYSSEDELLRLSSPEKIVLPVIL